MTSLRQVKFVKRMFSLVLATSCLCFVTPASAQYSLEDRLVKAARDGKVEEVRELLDKGADINAQKCYLALSRGLSSDLTALQCATANGHAEVVRLLLERGANLEIKDRDGKGVTALLMAADNHNIEITKLLLKAGADVNATNGIDSALYYVAQHSGLGWTDEITLEMAKLLLDAGADMNIRAGNYGTVLDVAKGNGPAALVDLMVQTQRQRQLAAEMTTLQPEERCKRYVGTLQQLPGDEMLREKVIQCALALPELPKVADEARQLFILGTSKIKQAKTVPELAEPVTLLRKATDLAPWWANAYYNLASVLELSGKYDEATTALNHYLELNPPEVEAREARARLGVIQTLKEAAIKSARKK